MAVKAMIVVGVLVAMACYAYALPSPGDYEVVEAVPVLEKRGDVGWGWSPPVQTTGWGWKPKVKYLKFSIPIPQLPRIRFGIKGGLRLHASVQNGWSRR